LISFRLHAKKDSLSLVYIHLFPVGIGFFWEEYTVKKVSGFPVPSRGVGLVPVCMGRDMDLTGSARINMVVSDKNRLGSAEE
jgi:hypothetical protein